MTEERAGVIEVEGRMKKKFHVLVFELADDNNGLISFPFPSVQRKVVAEERAVPAVYDGVVFHVPVSFDHDNA